MASWLPWSSIADPPNDSLGRFARVDRIAATATVNPDHDQPTAGGRPTDHLMRLVRGKFGLDPISLTKRLFNLLSEI
jgi:hypothetical protein